MCDSFVGKYERVHEENYEEYLKVNRILLSSFAIFCHLERFPTDNRNDSSSTKKVSRGFYLVFMKQHLYKKPL
jgi:hypothetical protein